VKQRYAIALLALLLPGCLLTLERPISYRDPADGGPTPDVLVLDGAPADDAIAADGARQDARDDGGLEATPDAIASDATALDGTATDGGAPDADAPDASGPDAHAVDAYATDGTSGADATGMHDASTADAWTNDVETDDVPILMPDVVSSDAITTVDAMSPPDASTCSVTCTTGTTCCDGRCVHLATDENNCGMCGRRCDSSSVCGSGTCSTCSLLGAPLGLSLSICVLAGSDRCCGLLGLCTGCIGGT
jgi:hypothetical protein